MGLSLRVGKANLRIGWKLQSVTNGLAYCGTEFITAVKKFTTLKPGRIQQSPLHNIYILII